MTPQQKQQPEVPYLTRTQVLVAMGITAIILWVISKLWLHLGNISLMSWQWHEKEILLGIGLGLTITGLSGIIYQIFPPYRRSADYYLEIVLRPLATPDLIWLGLLPGLSEELLFRGVMLPALGFDHLAVIVSSFCFGVLHLSSFQQWIYVVWASIVGLFFGYSALVTNNLLVPVVAHILTNLISSFLWKMQQSKVKN